MSAAEEVRPARAEAPAPGAVAEVAPGILWIRLPLPMALDHVNVYALDDGDGWTLVDTGQDDAPTRALWEALLAGPLSGRPVRRVIATHHHPDHIGLAGWFQGRGAELWTTRTAWLTARMLTLDAQSRPTAETLAFWRAAGMDAAEFALRAAERPFNFADRVTPLPLGFRRLVDGETITAAGRGWTVRFGQGHAPDHATLWSADGAVLLAGDQVIAGISPNIGVYATEPEADPLAEWLASCASFAAHARPGHLVLPGHKLPFTGLAARLAQLQHGHDAALERLRAWLDRPRTAAACFPVLYRRPIDRSIYGLALAETLAHLNRLRAAGDAVRRDVEGVWQWTATGSGGG